MNAKATDNRGAKFYIGVVLALAIMFLFDKIVPTWGTVTTTGVCCIGVFLGVIVAVIFTGQVLWPTMAAMVALTLGGYFPTINAAISGIFGHSLVYSFFLVTALITAMNDMGTGEAIASILLTRKFFQKKPVLLSFCFLMVFAIAVNFMNTVGTMLLAFPILDAILDYAGVDRKEKYAKFMNLGIFLAISLGFTFRGADMPDFLVRVELFNTALEGTGYSVNLGLYTIFGILAVTVFFVLYVLAMKYLFKCDFGKLSDTDFREVGNLKEKAKLNKYQVLFLCGFLMFALFGLVPKSVATLSKVGQYGVLGLICMILSFLKRKDEDGNMVKLFDFQKYLKTVNWDIAMSLGLFSVIGTAIGSDVCGIKEWMIEAVSSILSNNGATAISVICIVGISLITHVFNNNATATIFASLAAPLAVSYVTAGTLNPALLLSSIAICSQSGFMTMAASGTAPLLHTREGIDSKFIWTCGAVMEIIFILVVLVMYFLFAAL